MPFLHLKEHHIFLKFSLLFTVYFCGVGCSAWEVFWVLCLLFFSCEFFLDGYLCTPSPFISEKGPRFGPQILALLFPRTTSWLETWHSLYGQTDRRGCGDLKAQGLPRAAAALMWLGEGLLFSASLEIFMLGEFSQTLQCEFPFWCISKCGVGGWAL